MPLSNLNLHVSIRSPGPVTPRDVECEGFNLTYPRIANDKLNAMPGAHSTLEYDVDKKVDSSITTFLTTLSQIGPELLSVRVEHSFQWKPSFVVVERFTDFFCFVSRLIRAD